MCVIVCFIYSMLHVIIHVIKHVLSYSKIQLISIMVYQINKCIAPHEFIGLYACLVGATTLEITTVYVFPNYALC